MGHTKLEKSWKELRHDFGQNLLLSTQ